MRLEKQPSFIYKSMLLLELIAAIAVRKGRRYGI
jgi:hypothetical protein